MMKQVYWDNILSYTRGFERYNRFKDCHVPVKDDLKSRRPSTSRTEVNVVKVRPMVCEDYLLTIQMIASLLDMQKYSVWKINPEDLAMSEK